MEGAEGSREAIATSILERGFHIVYRLLRSSSDPSRLEFATISKISIIL
jgi:hypothetical protein